MSIWKTADGKIVKNGSGKVVSCADCPCTTADCECCTGSPTTWTVDLGAGGWVDDLCDACDLVAGEYVLTKFSDCLFQYTEAGIGSFDQGGGCSVWTVNLSITLQITQVGSDCVLSIEVAITSGGTAPCPGANRRAYYERTYAGTTIDCVGSDETINKSSETNPFYGTGYVCTGSMPATITATGNA